QLLCCTRFHSRATRHKLGANNYLYRIIGMSSEFGALIACDASRSNTVFARHAESANDVGCSSGSGNPDQHLTRTYLISLQICPRLLFTVLNMLHGPANGGIASRDDTDDPPLRHTVGRRSEE